ncbi:hypothetical protein, partial [Cohnella mopanensis]|uniref:hypothetical protein n=1 Tax=Cohnella mopanensis TaxID=2911966 RepID=UPI001EF75961
MSKLRSPDVKPLLRKAPADPKAKLSSRQSAHHQIKVSSGKNNKKESSKDDVVHLHQNGEQPTHPTRQIPWWVFPQEQERGLLGGLIGGQGGPSGPGMPGGLGGGMFP